MTPGCFAFGEANRERFPPKSFALLAAAGVSRTRLIADPFTWYLADKIPTVTLKPGEVYRLNVPLDVVLQKPKKADDPCALCLVNTTFGLEPSYRF